MGKRNAKILIVALVLALTVSGSALAVPEMPGGGGPGGGMTSTAITRLGATELSADGNYKEESYSSTTGGQNALLVSGGTVSLVNPTVEKSGDEGDENSDFYGTNAAVLAYNGATLNIEGGTVTTNGGHANGVFAYGSGVVNLRGTTINTTANNSGGVMVTGGGTLMAENLKVTTEGNSAAAIRSDRGGGTMVISGGSYQTNGVGSPAIYSTAEISVNDAELIATASEGVVIEGLNSVSLENVKLTDTNNTLNGNSETYKNIFIYQSMSGDAEEGTGSFAAKDSTIITNQGDTFFITNTTAKIVLENNTFANNDGAFLRAQSGKWGNSGSNGGQVSLSATDQEIEGGIVLDSISTLEMSLAGESYYRGMMNGSAEGVMELTLDAETVVVLEGDSYLSALNNADTANQNIYANGYKLYVEGVEVAINQDEPPVREVVVIATNESVDEVELPRGWWRFYLAGGVLIVALVVLVVVIKMKKNRVKRPQGQPEQPAVAAKAPEEEIIVSEKTNVEHTEKKGVPSSQTDIDVNDITPDDVE